ncbi:histidine phosphatase family protein [Psychromonas sp. 14N.309.X.WAT.B.A12]|uniref:histidine phosphatase family protein n=1 Tax=unclassified Psychromonas TaxID=2614957 RepID=UPI0025B03B1C|nr:histidine phosphatase family protein [Psychromonas sp. 14N.309.X.WAT.B.A12]MDN2664239.1 histidine phosphatase family protein [Psychromonas sp. 14N.309.X.WAT.B.A12]
MNNQTTFYLARHGQTEWNVAQRIQGQLDSPLTPQGKQQAALLAEQCRQLNITKILTSPLGRAVQTADVCGQLLQITPVPVKGFEERHFGDWQGKFTHQVNTLSDYDEITSQITDCKPKHGESSKQLVTRFEATLREELKNAAKEVSLIIIHGDILRCFMAQFIPHLTPNSGSKDNVSTGYDYKNAELIALSYDQDSGTFTSL